MLWVVPAAMAVAGMYTGEEKRKQAVKENLAQSEIARWSPWTGMKPEKVDMNHSALGGAMQGGVAGLGMTQNMQGSKKSPALTGEAPDSGKYDFDTQDPNREPSHIAGPTQSIGSPDYQGVSSEYGAPVWDSVAKRYRPQRGPLE